MQCEEKLRKHIPTLDVFQKMSLEDFKQLKMFDKDTQKIRNLLEYEYIDVECNLRNPLASPNTEDYIFCKEDTIYFTDIIFTSSEKVQFSKCEEKRLVFTNCIFLTTIVLQDSPKYIEFYNCCFNSIIISPYYKNISFYFSIIGKLILELNSDSCIKFNANSNEIGSFKCSNTNAESFTFYENEIHKIALINVKKLDDLDYQQIVLFKDELDNIREKQIMDIIDTKYPEEILFTLNYFLKLDGLKECATLCNSLELLKQPYIKRTKREKAILFLCGYFMKPMHMFIEAFVVIAIFIIPFMFKRNFNSFSYCLLDSIEKSITFFLSLGNPCGLNRWQRIFGYLESLLGFLDFTVFTISLGKKYLK